MPEQPERQEDVELNPSISDEEMQKIYTEEVRDVMHRLAPLIEADFNSQPKRRAPARVMALIYFEALSKLGVGICQHMYVPPDAALTILDRCKELIDSPVYTKKTTD